MKKKPIIIAVAVLAVIGAVYGAAHPDGEVSNPASETTAATTPVQDGGKKALEKEYKLSDPEKVIKDTTGKWRLNRMTGPGRPMDFALEYYKAFMQPDEIHFIINFSTNTATSIQELGGMLWVRERDHIKREELDAATLGSGTLLDEKYLSLETGEPVTVESESGDAAQVSSDDLVAKVSEILPDNTLQGTIITGVSLRDGKDLYITADVTGGQFDPDIMAETSVSSITDAILDLDASYYAAWDTITLDFGAQGHVTFGKSQVIDNALGKYFSYEGNVLKK